jgi:hypothetical protein
MRYALTPAPWAPTSRRPSSETLLVEPFWQSEAHTGFGPVPPSRSANADHGSSSSRPPWPSGRSYS